MKQLLTITLITALSFTVQAQPKKAKAVPVVTVKDTAQQKQYFILAPIEFFNALLNALDNPASVSNVQAGELRNFIRTQIKELKTEGGKK